MVVFTRNKQVSSETKVLVDELPEGIAITLTNAIRLLDDSILLAQHSRYENAIVNVTLAWEEFAETSEMLSDQDSSGDRMYSEHSLIHSY